MVPPYSGSAKYLYSKKGRFFWLTQYRKRSVIFGLPAGSKDLPAGSRALPAGSEALPAGSKALSAGSEALPAGS